jgi:hypothetical protein
MKRGDAGRSRAAPKPPSACLTPEEANVADTISSQSDWKANQKRAEKKAKTTTQPPMSEGDMVIRFRARNGRATREARETAMAK